MTDNNYCTIFTLEFRIINKSEAHTGNINTFECTHTHTHTAITILKQL